MQKRRRRQLVSVIDKYTVSWLAECVRDAINIKYMIIMNMTKNFAVVVGYMFIHPIVVYSNFVISSECVYQQTTTTTTMILSYSQCRFTVKYTRICQSGIKSTAINFSLATDQLCNAMKEQKQYVFFEKERNLAILLLSSHTSNRMEEEEKEEETHRHTHQTSIKFTPIKKCTENKCYETIWHQHRHQGTRVPLNRWHRSDTFRINIDFYGTKCESWVWSFAQCVQTVGVRKKNKAKKGSIMTIMYRWVWTKNVFA